MLENLRSCVLNEGPAVPSTRALRVYAALRHLKDTYPDFERWYWAKVVPGLAERTRELFVEQHAGKTIGVVIAKASASERKLCTVWVDDKFAGCGLGGRLMRQAMEWLGTDRPLISVPQERLSEFMPIFTAWQFDAVQALRSYYRAGYTEYVYNGRLPNTLASPDASAINWAVASDYESKIHSSSNRFKLVGLQQAYRLGRAT